MWHVKQQEPSGKQCSLKLMLARNKIDRKPVCKNQNEAKDVAQLEECLPNMHEAQCPITGTA